MAMAVVVAPVMGQDSDQEQESKFNYTVVDGEYADESTIWGFNVYTGTCAACHGPDGLGSAFAPSLVRAVQRRDFGDFAQTIAEGQSIQPGFVMPSFAEDERVMTHIEDLWNYLGARAEGGLERGRPRPLEDADDAGEAEENEG
jgi:mono/diheme cytochrome c family protein